MIVRRGCIDVTNILGPLHEELPTLQVHGVLARSLKCHVLSASLDGRSVVVKWLARPEPPWGWYFEREQKLLSAFAASGEGGVAPELLASGPRWMVLARIVGSAIVPGRLARDVDPTVVAAALRARHRLAQTTTPWPSFVPDGRTLAEMRSRLLEDPCDGLGWCTEGLARGAALGLIDLDDAALAIAALKAWPILARSHGDLLPRNVIVDGASARLVDLECAGDHPEAWDHALLWANLSPAIRRVVEADFGLDHGPRGQAFRACVVFALVRELKFARGARLVGELQKTLHDAVSALRSRGPLGD
jgi:hypothetical protein